MTNKFFLGIGTVFNPELEVLDPESSQNLKLKKIIPKISILRIFFFFTGAGTCLKKIVLWEKYILKSLQDLKDIKNLKSAGCVNIKGRIGNF
jgi:hypothetical protein